MDETWRFVPGYEGMYEVSDAGRVRSWLPWVPDQRVPRIKALHYGNWGYAAVTLTTPEGKQKSWRVHRLVTLAFLGPCPIGMEVRHLDGNPKNPRLSNLVYGTKSENQLDRLRHGTHNNAGKTECKHGHPYTPENTYWTTDGRRNCYICRRAQDAKRVAARRQARLAVRIA